MAETEQDQKKILKCNNHSKGLCNMFDIWQTDIYQETTPLKISPVNDFVLYVTANQTVLMV